jgi:hypothetical protein
MHRITKTGMYGHGFQTIGDISKFTISLRILQSSMHWKEYGIIHASTAHITDTS